MIAPLRHTPLLDGTLQNLFYPPEHYDYFARAGEFSFPRAGPLQRAALAADAAMLAYARCGEVRMTDAQLRASFARAALQCETIGENPSDWNAPGTQAVFASCPEFALCAFRGTERDDPHDLASDFDLFPRLEPKRQSSTSSLAHPHFANLFTEPCMVHGGFQRALDAVWDQIVRHFTDYREKHPGKEICFTGHSLGAALALLAFSRFSDPDRSVFTFGCPRVGNASFRDRVLSNPGLGVNRFVNYNDMVTHVPTNSFLYCQTPETCLRFAANGDLDTDDDSFKGDLTSITAAILGISASLSSAGLKQTPAPPSLVDHSPARYCFRLWDCV